MKKLLKNIPVLIFRILIVVAILLLICIYFKIDKFEKSTTYLSSYVDSVGITKIIFTDDEKNSEDLYAAYIFEDSKSINEFSSILNSAVVAYETKNLQAEMLGWWKKYIFIYYDDGSVEKLTFFGAGNRACSLDSNKDVVLNFPTTKSFTSFVREQNAKLVLIDNNLKYVKDFETNEPTLESYFGENYKKPWSQN